MGRGTSREDAIMAAICRRAGIILFIVAMLTGIPPALGDDGPNKERTDVSGDPLPPGAVARMGTVRFRHGRGSTLAFAADGKSLISFGGDRTLRFWDVVTGRLLRERALPNGDQARNAVLSPAGRLLAFQDFESMEALYLWDVGRNERRYQVSVGLDYQLRIAFSPDSKTLVTAHENGELRAWDLTTGKDRLLGKQKREALSLSFSADGTLMTLSWEPVLRFWDLKAGKQRSQIAIPEDIVGATVSADGRTVALWTFHNEDKDKGLRFLEAATGKAIPGWTPPSQKQIRTAQFSPDGKTVFVGTRDGLSIWDPVAGKEVHTFPNVWGVRFAFSPDGKTAAALGTGTQDDPHGALLHVWDLASGTPRAAATAARGHLHEVESLAFSPDGRILASACPGDRSVRFWDVSTGREMRSFSLSGEGGFRNLVLAKDGKQLFLGSSPAIVRRDAETGKELARYRLFEEGKGDRHHLLTMHLAADGRTLHAISQNLSAKGIPHALHAWDVATGKRLRFEPLDSRDFGLAYSRFSADGRLFTLGGSILDAATGKELLHPSLDGVSLMTPVAFSADGALLATGVYRALKGPKRFGHEMTALQIWELATLLPVARLETGRLAQVVFTPDGQRVITAGRDALKLWDLASGNVVARCAAPGSFWGSFGPSFASSIAVAPNGCTVATGHADTTILVWDLSPPARTPTAPPTAAQLHGLWTDLGSDDAGRAMSAHARLVEAPEVTTKLMRDRLRPAKAPSPDELRRLVAELNAAEFARRESATKQLADLGDSAEAALRAALQGEPPPESRRRIERLLAMPRLARTPEARRHLRAVRILEQIATPETRQVLQALAGGAAGDRLTRQANAALKRLQR
jgi:WD40 repeat protein